MSFSSDVKAELCRSAAGSRQNAAAECYGVLLFCNTFSAQEIRIVTGSREFAQRLPKLFQRAFGVAFDALPGEEAQGKRTFLLRTPESIGKILDAYGIDRMGAVAHHVNLGLLEEPGLRVGFLRGAFLSGGSVTDPQKRYHLELVTGHHSVSRELTALLMDMGFEPGIARRGGNSVLYFKQSGVIEDFLTTLGAPVSAMTVMSAKIEKDMTNSVNRIVNCDTANVAKTVEAAATQLAAIQRLRDSGRFESLPERLRDTALLRERYPELALSELAAACDPPVTKSCLNHRLRRLCELADEHS